MTTKTVPLTTAETLRKAADLVADNGLFADGYWHPSAVEWQPGMPLCPVAAIGVARGWTRISDVCHHVAGQGRRSRVDPAVTALLQQHLDLDNVAELYDWVSDHAGEVGRVVALLRAVADEQDARKRMDFSYQAGGAA